MHGNTIAAIAPIGVRLVNSSDIRLPFCRHRRRTGGAVAVGTAVTAARLARRVHHSNDRSREARAEPGRGRAQVTRC
jgi:hypothetical protein